MDLTSDLLNIFTARLSAYGYQARPSDSFEDVAKRYFNVQKRRISVILRTVHEAQSFQCPADLRVAYDALKAKLVQGQDCTPHMSTLLVKDDYDDLVLNDWGISHFHLSLVPHANKPGFLDRTGPLLLAYVTADAVYALGVYEHGEWADDQLIRILHDNWPDVIEQYRMKGVLGVERKATPAERLQLRKHGILSSVQLSPGVVYFPPGGGYASNGISIEAVRQVNWCKQWLAQLEDYLGRNATSLMQQISASGSAPNNPPDFFLTESHNALRLEERASGFNFELSHPNPLSISNT